MQGEGFVAVREFVDKQRVAEKAKRGWSLVVLLEVFPTNELSFRVDVSLQMDLVVHRGISEVEWWSHSGEGNCNQEDGKKETKMQLRKGD